MLNHIDHTVHAWTMAKFRPIIDMIPGGIWAGLWANPHGGETHIASSFSSSFPSMPQMSMVKLIKWSISDVVYLCSNCIACFGSGVGKTLLRISSMCLQRCVYSTRYLTCVAVFYHFQVQVLTEHGRAPQRTVNINAELRTLKSFEASSHQELEESIVVITST